MPISLNGDGIVSGVTTFTTPLTGVTTFSSVDATSVVVGSAVTINSSGINVGTGVTIYASSGIVSATTFYGDASGLTNVPAGSSVTGNFTITNGNVVVSNGYGVDFSATANSSGTMSSELFDDYEEGTWTPTLTGNTGGSYTPGGSNYGWYRKVGNLVTVGGTLQWTAQVTPYSGLLLISGLPFTNGANRSGGTLGGGNGLTLSAGYSSWVASIDIGGSAFYILQVSSTNNSYSHYPAVSTSGVIYGFMVTYGTT